MRLTKRRTLATAGTACAIGAAVLGGWSALTAAASTGSSKPSSGRFDAGEIPALAKQMATVAGDAAPTLIQHVSATRAAANRIAGGDIILGTDATTPSYLIAMKGSFTVQRPLPPGAPQSLQGTVTYSVLTLVVNAETGRVMDSGLTNSYPDLASLGPVATDSVG
jgi:hypothetical protein